MSLCKNLQSSDPAPKLVHVRVAISTHFFGPQQFSKRAGQSQDSKKSSPSVCLTDRHGLHVGAIFSTERTALEKSRVALGMKRAS